MNQKKKLPNLRNVNKQEICYVIPKKNLPQNILCLLEMLHWKVRRKVCQIQPLQKQSKIEE